MGITNSNKFTDVQQTDCSGTVKVTLALTAAPDIITNPTDIVLVLDRSGSMAGTPLADMKTGAKTFIDIISQSTGGQPAGEIGSGSRMGIVSFSDTAVDDTGLITSVAALKTAVDSLSAGGSTNHADAFSKASALFDPASSNAKVIVMFTDGETTAGPPPAPVAAAARAQGIIIYCIGLLGSGGVDVNALNDWATDPDATHVAVTPDTAQLEALFARLAANISKTGATNIVINETVSPDFVITSINSPVVGTAVMLNSNSLLWTIPELGVTASQSALLEFFVKHTGAASGVKPINASVTYSDTEGNIVVFPDPEVTVQCETPPVEPCTDPIECSAECCSDSVEIKKKNGCIKSVCRIIKSDVRIKNIPPCRCLELTAMLIETDECGFQHQCGSKTVIIPAHSFSSCGEALVKGIVFTAAERCGVNCRCPGAVCKMRNLSLRFAVREIGAHYSDCEASLQC